MSLSTTGYVAARRQQGVAFDSYQADMAARSDVDVGADPRCRFGEQHAEADRRGRMTLGQHARQKSPPEIFSWKPRHKTE
jgi:hypothetical protein